MNNKTSFYSEEEIQEIGFKSVGKDVLISRHISFYSPEKISIGSHVRIDDFCILSGNITIGNYVHIAAGCYLFAGEYGIILKIIQDFRRVVLFMLLLMIIRGNT